MNESINQSIPNDKPAILSSVECLITITLTSAESAVLRGHLPQGLSPKTTLEEDLSALKQRAHLRHPPLSLRTRPPHADRGEALDTALLKLCAHVPFYGQNASSLAHRLRGLLRIYHMSMELCLPYSSPPAHAGGPRNAVHAAKNVTHTLDLEGQSNDLIIGSSEVLCDYMHFDRRIKREYFQ